MNENDQDDRKGWVFIDGRDNVRSYELALKPKNKHKRGKAYHNYKGPARRARGKGGGRKA